MVTIRAFELGDAATCCKVINAAIQSMDGLNPPAKLLIAAKNVPEALGADLARGFTLVAVGTDGLEAVGMLDGSEVKRLYVHPRFQRRGVGTVILRALEAEARKRGLHRIELRASPSSVPFYLALGFRQLGTESSRSGDAEFTYVNMSKDLV